MNGATLRIYRQILGISQEDLAERLGYKNRKTIQRWENESWEIPLSAAAEIEQLFYERIDEIEDYIKAVEEFISNTGKGEPQAIDLSIYRSASSYRRGIGENAPGMTWSEHTAKVAQLCAELTALGYAVNIDYVPSED